MTPTAITLKVRASETLVATVSPENATNKTVTWTTNDASVATVADGVVTGIKAGTATITATSNNGKTAICVVTVEAASIVEEVFGSMTAYGDFEVEDDTVTFDGEIKWYPEDEALKRAAGNRVGVKIFLPEDEDYKTSDIVEIKIGENTYEWEDIKDGEDHFQWWPLVTEANQEFTATIKWNSASEQTFTIKIADEATLADVVVPVSSISVDKTTMALLLGEPVTGIITATIEPQNSTNKTVTWTTSNADVATVDNGVVTAVAEGIATITATAGGKTATCEVAVIGADANVVNISKSEIIYETITAAIADAEAGNTLVLAAGPYNEVLDINKSVTIKGIEGALPVINAEGAACAVISANDVTLEGIAFKGTWGVQVAEDITGTVVNDCSITLANDLQRGEGALRFLGGNGTVNASGNTMNGTLWVFGTGEAQDLSGIVDNKINGALFTGIGYHANDNTASIKDGLTAQQLYDAQASITVSGEPQRLVAIEDSAWNLVDVLVNNADGLKHAVNKTADNGTISLVNGCYYLDSTLNIAKSVTIEGGGSSVNQAVHITGNNVTIKNLTGTVVPREEHKISDIGGQSAFVITANNVVLDNITVDGKSEANSAAVRGLWDAQFEVINSNISNVQTGIFAHHGNTKPEAVQNVLIATGNTFTNVWAGIGGTEKTDLTATGNTFVSIQDNGEGIGLGNGVVVIGADTEDDVNYLETNNTFNYSEGNKVVDYRSAVANTSQGKYYDTINAAITEAKEGNVIHLRQGIHKIARTADQDNSESAYLEINVDGLKIIGFGNPTITTDDVGTGNWQDQQLIVVRGDGITIEGVTLIGNISEYNNGEEVSVVNKIIEVFGDNFTLKNTTIDARDEYDGGTIYYSCGEGKTSTLENIVLERGRISLSAATNLTLNLKDVEINYIGSSSEGDGYLPIWKLENASNVVAENVVARVGAASSAHLEETIKNLPVGTTLELAEDINVSGNILIEKAITIDGKDKKLTSTANMAGEALDKHSAIKIPSSGSGTVIKNLTVEATGYTGDVLYVSTATDVEITGNTFKSVDSSAMGVYFDKSSSGKLTNNVIEGRKGVGADTVGNVTITGNDITFTKTGIELYDGNSASKQEINNTSSEQDVALDQYTVSGNTFNKVTK